jgi:protein ImuB
VTDRIACAVVPALPLQVLLRRRGEPEGTPVAVVDRDSPTGRVLWASPAAIRGGVLPGLRYAAALALCRDLRAGTVPGPEIRAEVARLAAVLRRHSPGIEPSDGEPGVFWLEARGLVPLYASLAEWRERLLDALRAERYVARAAVGFSRFGSFAAARAGREPGVFEDPAAERVAALGAPLRLLGLPPADRDALERLGVFRVRDLLVLPAAGIASRFGPETARLRRLAAGDLPDPLEPVPGEEAFRAREILEHAETDAARLHLLLDRLLAPLAARLAERDRAAAAVAVRLSLDDGGTALLDVRPAAPTRDARHLAELLRLRLEATRLASGVVEAAIEIRAAPADPGERRLFADRGGRDAAAAGRALARVRAEFGSGSAARARLRDAHLPEASFEWAPIEGALPPPRPRTAPRQPLVRRLLGRPLPIAAPGGTREAPWSPGGLRAGAAVPAAGPFAVSGGWWAREVRREYHWIETRGGDVLWAFHDRVRRRWFLQGRVE